MKKIVTVTSLVLTALLALCAAANAANITLARATSPSTPAGASPMPGYAHTYLHLSLWSSRLANANSGLTPAQLRKAYGVNRLPNQGQGTTIAAVVAGGNPKAQADLNQYDAAYALPATTITVVYPQGKPARVDSSWALEADLDLQMLHAMAPQARLVLEAASSAANADLYGAAQDAYTKQGATVVVMSFGGAEFAGETGPGADGIFLAGNNAGVSFVASSGDGGTGAQYPAASPFVIGVGGTTLSSQPDGSYISETAWGGSGGGVSAYERRPGFQSGFNGNARRGIPDVAMVADPATGVSVYDSFGYQGRTGFYVIGGTSASAPLFAGVLTLSSARGSGQALYNAAGSHYAADYHDITSGSNGNCGAFCQAHSGYDYVTGLGSPVANRLVLDLAG